MILLQLREHKPRAEICAEYGISQARLSQIITETVPMMPDEEKRAELLLKYEQMERRAWEHAVSPGRPMFNGEGKHAKDGNTGDFAYDPSPSIQALDILNRMLGNEARLYGVDKPVPKPVEENRDLNSFVDEYRRLALENQALAEQVRQLRDQVQVLHGSTPADVVLPAGHPGDDADDSQDAEDHDH